MAGHALSWTVWRNGKLLSRSVEFVADVISQLRCVVQEKGRCHGRPSM